ncbi:MAG TPA: ABC transporter substrate-binding protein [Casimicrobiaceae bacterium]|nr:ABC transporter substrate-binding protein [Casimicrobiaceae bacterium]
MDRRAFVAALAGSVMLPLPAGLLAQGQGPVRRIGYLSAFSRPDIETFVVLLRPELDKLGWTEGRNLVLLEVRTTEGRNERLPALAAELVAQRPDLVLVQSAPATRAMMQATTSIPLVMIGVGNPLETGVVANLAKPGGNVTGSGYLADESILKLLQLLKEAVPRLRSVALFVNPSNEGAAPLVKQFRADAASQGMRVQVVEVTGPADFDAAFAAILREGIEAILLPPEPLIRGNRAAISSFALAHGLPLAITGSSIYLSPGALMSYGPTTAQYAQLTARYIDRILRGAKPGDLAIEQPSRFELAISVATAKALGLSLSDALLQRADQLR